MSSERGFPEGVGPDAFVTVQMSRELVAELREWSAPVQMKVERLSDASYTFTARPARVGPMCAECEATGHVLVCTGERRHE